MHPLCIDDPANAPIYFCCEVNADSKLGELVSYTDVLLIELVLLSTQSTGLSDRYRTCR